MDELRKWYAERSREWEARRPWLWPLLIGLALAGVSVQPGLLGISRYLPVWLASGLIYALPILYLLLGWQLLAKLDCLRAAAGQFPALDDCALRAGLQRLDLAMLGRYCMLLLAPYMLSWELLMGPAILWNSLSYDYQKFPGLVTAYMAASIFFALAMTLIRVSVIILLLAIMARLPRRVPLFARLSLLLILWLGLSFLGLQTYRLRLAALGEITKYLPIHSLAGPRFEFYVYFCFLILLLLVHKLLPLLEDRTGAEAPLGSGQTAAGV